MTSTWSYWAVRIKTCHWKRSSGLLKPKNPGKGQQLISSQRKQPTRLGAVHTREGRMQQPQHPHITTTCASTAADRVMANRPHPIFARNPAQHLATPVDIAEKTTTWKRYAEAKTEQDKYHLHHMGLIMHFLMHYARYTPDSIITMVYVPSC